MKVLEVVRGQWPGFRTVVVGHSLGGAIADLAAADLRRGGAGVVDLYTFGAPRVGGPIISDYISGISGIEGVEVGGGSGSGNGSTYRVTHLDDPVPKLPPRGWGFADVGPEYWISAGNGVGVGGGDVTVVEGGEMGEEGDGGDVGVGELLGLDVAAHLWYFGPISSCDRQMEDLFASA